MGFPVAFGNPPGTEQHFCYFPVGAAVHPCIERTQRKREPPAAALRLRMQRRPQGPAIKGSPQAPACIDAEIEIAVERKLDSIVNRNDRRFFQPNAMLYAAQVQHGVPAVRALPQLGFVQVAEVQADSRMRADKGRWPHGNNRRQNLWRPEDGLFEIGLIGISCEKPIPNAAEIQLLR